MEYNKPSFTANEAQITADLIQQNVRSQRLIAQYEEVIYKQPTLRDQFAMAALPRVIGHSRSGVCALDDALIAYQIADAMLEARKQTDKVNDE